MSDHSTENDKQEIVKPTVQKMVDESPGLNIEARFKIFDPDTGEVMLEGRG
jgi:hypothetical protein